MDLTKKIKIDPDANTVISGMEWREDNGRIVGVLRCGQLSRDLYIKVNKALEALGGKWDRKASGHVFKEDPRPTLADALGNGYVKVARDGFFETPLVIGRKMASLADIKPGMMVLEPSAGLGALTRVILEVQPDCILSVIEKNPAHSEALRQAGYNLIAHDFIEYAKTLAAADNLVDRVIQNPPFELLQDIDHIMTAYNMLKACGKLVSVISESPFFVDNRKARDFREWLWERQHSFVNLAHDAFRESGTGVRARLVVIDRLPVDSGAERVYNVGRFEVACGTTC